MNIPNASSPVQWLDFANQDVLGEAAAALSRSSPSLLRDPVYQERIKQWALVHDQAHEVIWTTGFHVLDETPLLPCPQTVSVQTVCDPRYRSEGAIRRASSGCYFCYTLSGQGSFQDQRQTYTMSAGRAFLTEINDSNTGYFYPQGATETWRFLAFTFAGLPAQSMLRALTKTYGPVYDLDPQTPILKRLLGFEARKYAFVDLHALDAAMLVLDVLAAVAAEARAGDATDAATVLVRRAIEICGARLEEDLTVEQLAALTGVSREHLSRAFRKRLGVSPRQFLQRQKMQYARYLLKESPMPIKQIAGMLGYATYANFLAAFQKETGVTPRAFRLSGIFAPAAAPFFAIITESDKLSLFPD